MTLAKTWILKKLSRNTSSGNFIPEIDGLRCLAIAAVIAFHLAGYVAEKSPLFTPAASDSRFYQLLRTGHIGVQLFFIISGFVVALPFANHRLSGGKKVDLRKYFIRRLTRIEPPYVIALLFWLFAFGISGLGEAPFHELLKPCFPASLFYLHNAIYHHPSLVLPPAWSLEIEIQFYLLAPLFTLVFCISNPLARRGVLTGVVASLAYAQQWLRNPDQINGLHLGQEAHYFFVGLLLVDFYITRWRQTEPESPIIGDILATISLITLPATLMLHITNQLLIAALLLMFVASVLRSRFWRAVFRNPWIYTFGGMCYTTYLYHGFFKALPGHFTIRWQIGHSFWLNFLLQSIMLIPIIIIGSTILFVLTEKPFMRGSHRNANGHTANPSISSHVAKTD